MNLPIPTGGGILSTHLRALSERLDRLKPQASPDIASDATTRGVIRRPVRARGSSIARRKVTARWA